MAQSEKSPIKIFGNDALSSRVAAFQKKADEPYKRKKSNPFLKSPMEGSTPVEGLAPETDEVGVMANSSKSPVKIYGNDALSTRVALFQQRAEDHKKKQKSNPFSAVGGSNLNRPQLDKNDPNYGRPVEGSKTEKRGLAAGAHIGNEVQYLCSIITEFGEPCEDGSTVISFGELFEIYSRISNKVVGILLRARKHGLVHFEGEMLFQRRDDDVIIMLLKPIAQLREEWGVKDPSAPQKRKQPGELIMSPEDY